MGLFGPIDLQRAVEMIIILLISIDVHELAHALVADRLGDRTPRQMGELSLNPFVHMDQVGVVLLLITSLFSYGFTYGRTHVNPRNLRFGPQRGNALVALAGPLSNLILAGLLGIGLGYLLTHTVNAPVAVLNFLYLGLVINVLLFVFNLIPIPPLDGFTIVGGFLSARQMYSLAPLQQYGPMLILLLFFADPYIHVISRVVIPIVSTVSTFVCQACTA